MSEELKPTDEQCDRIVALTMDKLAAKGCDQYGDMHALDLNPNIMEHHSLRRSIVRAAYGVGEAEAIAAWNRRAQPAAPSDEVAAVLRYCRAVQQEGTVNERVVAQTVARMLVQPEAAEPKGADGLPVSAPRLYADEEPPGHADHVPKARNLFGAAPPVAPEPVVHCWSVSVDGRFLFHSANLHDARLRLDGDFVWDDDRLAFAKEVIAKLNAAHPPRAPLTDGKLWSWTRSVMSQAACIQQDYAAGKFSGYEQYSAHLDAAAATRADELEARISAHGIGGKTL